MHDARPERRALYADGRRKPACESSMSRCRARDVRSRLVWRFVLLSTSSSCMVCHISDRTVGLVVSLCTLADFTSQSFGGPVEFNRRTALAISTVGAATAGLSSLG